MSFSSMEMGSSSFTPHWDVFLSFRGVDTRYNFTAHLYEALDRSGIQTFKDDPELRSGEEISSSLLQAIQESKISILVISGNYASSPWCLKELVEILQCMHRFHQLVLPVFYKVIPSDVRHQLGSFGKNFEKLEVHYGQDQLKKWRVALTEAAGLLGYSVDANKDEAKLIKEIVERVRVELMPKKVDVAQEPVGIAPHVEKIQQLLGDCTDGIRKIGIYGMGGVGKTTIAKAVYNEICHSFQGSCFLANVREVWGQANGIVQLQKQLMYDVLKEKTEISDADNGKRIIRERLVYKKVVIVLDDLDHKQQLQMFLAGAPGSIVLITARDADLLVRVKVDEKYMVQELNPRDSSELFCRHAFGQPVPPEGFAHVTQKVVGYANGLPLALELLGSNLCYQGDMSSWQVFIDKLQQVPNHDINQKLMISYDALPEDDLKAMFLDIACFFFGWEKEEVTTILSACYNFAENDIGILERRCLLKFHRSYEDFPDEYLWMHDLLRDMGREMIRIESPKEPEKRSRLWNYADICSVLNKNKGTNTLEAIFLPRAGPPQPSLTAETFKKMDRLRLLDIDRMNLTGNFEDIFDNLRWFRWHNCKSLPSGFHSRELVILDLSYCTIRNLTNLDLPSLKILNLNWSYRLKTIKDFKGLPSLEELDLRFCMRLVEIDASVGGLRKLIHIHLSRCDRLEILPSTISNLTSLKYLNLSGCKSLKILPSTICNLIALETLDVYGCYSLKELPEEIGNIQSLKELLTFGSGITTLPHSIARLENLTRLELGRDNDLCEESDIDRLPEDLGNCKSLRVLKILNCTILEKLPDSFGNLTNLRVLDLYGCKNLINLPGSINQLRRLEHLNLAFCSNLENLPDHLTKLPDSIGQLSKLISLDLEDCKCLSILPDSICNLRALKRLCLDGCSSLRSLPERIGSIESLEQLDLACCEKLTNLPHSICNLKALLELDIRNCSNLQGLPEELWRMESLRQFIGDGIKLKNIPDSIGNLNNLEFLSLKGTRAVLDSPSEIRFIPPSIDGLSFLRKLDLSNCSLVEEDIQDTIGSLCSLQYLFLTHNHFTSLPSSLVQLSNLTLLSLDECTSLESLPNLSTLGSLETLDLFNCEKLTNLPDSICNLKALLELDISGCSNLHGLPEELGKMESLRELRGDGIKLTRIPDSIGNLKNLKFLSLGSTRPVLDSPSERFIPPSIEGLCSLQELDLSNCSLIDGDIPDTIGSLSSLKRLYLTDNHFTSLPSSLVQLSNLTLLSLGGCTSLESLPNLSNWTFLEELYLSNCSILVEIQGLENLPLRRVEVDGCKNLKKLKIWNCSRLVKISGLGNLQLESVSVDD